MALGLVHAGLDEPEEAIRLGRAALEACSISEDAWAGPIVARNMALLLARAGEVDAALDQVEELLDHPNPGASPALFRIEPRLDGLRDDPRFEELVTARPIEGP